MSNAFVTDFWGVVSRVVDCVIIFAFRTELEGKRLRVFEFNVWKYSYLERDLVLKNCEQMVERKK